MKPNYGYTTGEFLWKCIKNKEQGSIFYQEVKDFLHLPTEKILKEIKGKGGIDIITFMSDVHYPAYAGFLKNNAAYIIKYLKTKS